MRERSFVSFVVDFYSQFLCAPECSIYVPRPASATGKNGFARWGKAADTGRSGECPGAINK